MQTLYSSYPWPFSAKRWLLSFATRRLSRSRHVGGQERVNVPAAVRLVRVGMEAYLGEKTLSRKEAGVSGIAALTPSAYHDESCGDARAAVT